MKVKLLKRFRKKVPIYYSRSEKKVYDSASGKELEGKFIVTCPVKWINYHCRSKKIALYERNRAILRLLEDYRVKNYRTERKLKL